MKYLLDTNVVSTLISRRPEPRVVEWLDRADPASVYLSVITIGELRKGIEKLPASARKEALHAWLADDLLIRFQGNVLVLDVDVMLRWGVLTGQLERAGRPLPAMDSLIAALALHHSCHLVTHNAADFLDTSVHVINPWLTP